MDIAETDSIRTYNHKNYHFFNKESTISIKLGIRLNNWVETK